MSKKSYTLDKKDQCFVYKFYNLSYSNWKLYLDVNSIKIGRKIYPIESIDSLIYEVNGTTYHRNPYGPTLCVASVYLNIKNTDNPKHLLTLAVEEDYVLAKDSEAFLVASDLVKIISQKYNIPTKYSLGVETNEKNIGLIVASLMMPVIWIIIYLMNK